MIGRGGSNLQQIMSKTGASICFPDHNSGVGAAKGTVLITGTIDNVLAARECIIVCIALVVYSLTALFVVYTLVGCYKHTI